MPYDVRIGGNRTYTFDSEAQARRFMRGRRVIQFYPDKDKFKVVVRMNPGEVLQAVRRAEKAKLVRRNSITTGMGLGAYKGVTEPSYKVRAERLEDTETLRRELGQESLYAKGKGEAVVYGEGWKEKTRYLLFVEVFSKKFSPEQLLSLLSASDYALFSGGTLTPTNGGYLIESAVLWDTANIKENQMRRIERALEKAGVRIKVHVRRVR